MYKRDVVDALVSEASREHRYHGKPLTHFHIAQGAQGDYEVRNISRIVL